MVQSGVESPTDTTIEMELDLLEQKIQEAASLIERLRSEKRSLEEECTRLRSERGETLNRLSRILEKVDSLAGGS
ncbi:MAG: cell division protein ZapB [Candidatus Eisenbacteria bacterium]